MGCNQPVKGFVRIVKGEPLLYLTALNTGVDKGSRLLNGGRTGTALRRLEGHEYDVRLVHRDPHARANEERHPTNRTG